MQCKKGVNIAYLLQYANKKTLSFLKVLLVAGNNKLSDQFINDFLAIVESNLNLN